MPKRASWLKTWLEVAVAISKRSECVRDQVGAVIVDDRNRVVATGYNGKPSAMAAVSALGCSGWCPRAGGMEPRSSCIAVHAEANALLWGDRRERENGYLYITRPPCHDCSKLIANSGVSRVVWLESPEDKELGDHAERILRQAHVRSRAVYPPELEVMQ